MTADHKKTALIIDDDDILREMMNVMLSRMGYTVVAAENGNKAVEAAETWNGDIDVAIMDLFLPDIRGDKVCPKILKKHPNMKIIVMSGYGLEDTKILNTEVHGFIQKPCSYEALGQVLEKAFA